MSLSDLSAPTAPVHSQELLNDFFAALRPHVRGRLLTDAVSRALYATDASLYEIMPVGVLVPEHEDDVQAALETASRFGVPVLPRGGGSSLAGQTVGPALVVDFSKHLNGLLEINTEEQYVRVQPGLVLDPLTAALAPHGLQVGPDPASSSRATLGGMVANNATGTHSLLYGNVIHHVRSVAGFLAGGHVHRMHLFYAPRIFGDDGVPAFTGVDVAGEAESEPEWMVARRAGYGDDTLVVLDRRDVRERLREAC